MRKEMKKEIKENIYCLPIGSRLNQRYVIKKVLGEGGFGITYLGWDEILEMPVAMKEYYPEGMVGRRLKGREEHTLYTYEDGKRVIYEKGKEAFLKEARMLSQFFGLEGIVLVRDYFQENGTAYIVMEYIEGISVKEKVREEGSFSVEEMMELMKPVLQSLAVIHKKGLIHRDLSPDNIIITSQGKLKLIDFGAARYASAQEQKTITLMYKRGFAAFEQYRIKGELGAWTDVYGIAATMYFMLTGRVPEEAADRVIRDELIPLREVSKGMLSSRVGGAIGRAMEVLPEDRYSDIEEFYQELYDEAMPVVEFGKRKTENAEEAVKEGKNSESSTTSHLFFSTRTLGQELQRIIGKQKNVEHKKSKKKIGLIASGLCIIQIIVFMVWKAGVWQQRTLSVTTENAWQKALQRNQEFIQEKPSIEPDMPSTSMQKVDTQLISVPNLVGTTRTKAKQKLEQAGLSKVQWKYQYSDKVAKGKIIRQNIPEDKEFDKDKKIVLTVSKGKKTPEETSQSEKTQSSSSSPSSEESSNSTNSSSEEGNNSNSQKSDGQNFVGSLDSVFE